MARQLVDDMTSPWKPESFRDAFKDEIMALVEKKVKAGKTETVMQPEAAESGRPSAQIIDLTELLQRSLGKGGKAAAAGDKEKPARPKTPAKPAAKPAGKTARKTAPAARRRAA